MNERIKELATQAGVLPTTIGPTVETRYTRKKNESLRKFAELIVLECAAMTRNLSAHGELAEKAVKEHFGVKP